MNPMKIVADLLKLVDDMMPGVQHISLPDYQLLNEAQVEARRFLAQPWKPLTEAPRDGTLLLIAPDKGGGDENAFYRWQHNKWLGREAFTTTDQEGNFSINEDELDRYKYMELAPPNIGYVLPRWTCTVDGKPYRVDDKDISSLMGFSSVFLLDDNGLRVASHKFPDSAFCGRQTAFYTSGKHYVTNLPKSRKPGDKYED